MNPFRSILSRKRDLPGKNRRYLICAECGDLFRPMPDESQDWCRQCIEMLREEANQETDP